MHYLPVLTMSNPHFYYPCYPIKRSEIELYIANPQPAGCHPGAVPLNYRLLICNLPFITPV